MCIKIHAQYIHDVKYIVSKKHLKMLEKEMKKAAENLEFEQAAKIRDLKE